MVGWVGLEPPSDAQYPGVLEGRVLGDGSAGAESRVGGYDEVKVSVPLLLVKLLSPG